MNFLCPDCGSVAFKRNGFTRHGKQNHRCLDCGRQFSHELKDFSEVERIEIQQNVKLVPNNLEEKLVFM